MIGRRLSRWALAHVLVGLRTRVGLRNHVLDGSLDPHGKGQF